MNSVYNLVSKIIYSEPNPGGRVPEIKSSTKTLLLREELLEVKYILLRVFTLVFIHANLLFFIAEIPYLQFFLRSHEIILMHPKWLVFNVLLNDT